MTEAQPIACSLDAGGLRERLAEIGEIGNQSLIERATEGARHLLRFRADAATQARLAEIVAAEAACCPFLELALEDRGGYLILSIAAPPDGQAVADELASAFAGASG